MRAVREISPAEARQALYIDFEGETDKAPVLLGCARRPGRGSNKWVWQAITDPEFEPVSRADGIELLPLPDAIERILQRAEARNCRIVAWSQHELDIVEEYCPEKLDRFAARYVNARLVAVRWRNKCYGGRKPETNTLADYLVLIGYGVPGHAGPGHVGETIRIVRKSLEKSRGIDGLTEKQLRRWSDLREHNLHDCAGMREVCLRASREIAALSAVHAGRPTLRPVTAELSQGAPRLYP
jgi:hypothetical protein